MNLDCQVLLFKEVIDSKFLQKRTQNIRKILLYDVRKGDQRAANWQVLFFLREGLKRQRYKILHYADEDLLVQIIPKGGGPPYMILALHQAKFYQNYIQKFMQTYHMSEQQARNQIVDSIQLMVENACSKFENQRCKNFWKKNRRKTKKRQVFEEQEVNTRPNTLCTLSPVAGWKSCLQKNGHDHRQLNGGLTGLAIHIINILLVQHMTSQKNIQSFISKDQQQQNPSQNSILSQKKKIKKKKPKIPQKQPQPFNRTQRKHLYFNKIYSMLKQIIDPSIRDYMSSEQIYTLELEKLEQIDKFSQLDSWEIHKQLNKIFQDHSYHPSKYYLLKNVDYQSELKAQVQYQKLLKIAVKKIQRQLRQNKFKKPFLNTRPTIIFQPVQSSQPEKQRYNSYESPYFRSMKQSQILQDFHDPENTPISLQCSKMNHSIVTIHLYGQDCKEAFLVTKKAITLNMQKYITIQFSIVIEKVFKDLYTFTSIQV